MAVRRFFGLSSGCFASALAFSQGFLAERAARPPRRSMSRKIRKELPQSGGGPGKLFRNYPPRAGKN